MSKGKVKINSIDIILIFVIIVICLFSVVRNENIREFNNRNNVQNTIITVSVKGINKTDLLLFENNDYVKCDYGNESFDLGKIIDIKSAPAVIMFEGGNSAELAPDFSKLDIILEIESECLLDEKGFFSINGKYIAPSCSFSCENGKIKFDCEVVSVKTAGM